ERGVFGGIFGIMISCGYSLATGVGSLILAHFPWYAIFLIPSGARMLMFIVDVLVVRNTPKDAGFENFNTGDASAGDETPIDFSYLMKRVFSNLIIITQACAEFCTGFVRQGLLLYFTEFLHEVHGILSTNSRYQIAATGIT